MRDCNGCTALHAAVTGGNYECVKMLLSRGASVLSVDAMCNSPLHHAAYANKKVPHTHTHTHHVSLSTLPPFNFLQLLKDILELLLDHVGGQGVDQVNAFGETALQMAIAKGSLQAVKLLEAQGADLSCITPRGNYQHLDY